MSDGYLHESVRWLTVRARAARASRNFADENTFLLVAREIKDLREAGRAILAGDDDAYLKLRAALGVK